jgi:hypothetical protein
MGSELIHPPHCGSARMRIPTIKGVIDRRILVNYRVDTDALAAVLPAPFRPKLVNGHGIAGICLIRLKQIRPRFLPRFVGIASENAAHRIAVEWEQNGKVREGVYIPRRDTSSRINALAGGRLFPGVHHHARFDVQEDADRYSVFMRSDDGEAHVSVVGRVASKLPSDSAFDSLDEASNFFEQGSLGYSATPNASRFDGWELRTVNWTVTPLDVEKVESSFFDDDKLFPNGSAQFDCALLMRGIEHEWHGRESICIEPIRTASLAQIAD